jgi:hypothetical protein
MAVVCRSLNLLFIQNPRTGCSAIGRHLVEAYDGEYIPRDESRPRGFHKHASLEDIVGSGSFNREQLEGLLKFAGVRNPFDSIASYYQKRLNWSRIPPERREKRRWWKRKRVRRQVEFVASHSFEDFVVRFIDSEHRPSLTGLAEGVDMVVRFECMDPDFSRVLRRAGIEDPASIAPHNPTKSKSEYQSYYSPRAREVIERVYRDDLERYGYAFEGLR